MHSEIQPQPLASLRVALLSVAVVGLAFLAACSVHHETSGEGEKKVEVKTPFTDIKVNTDADTRETGIAAYPGAWRKPGDEHDKHSANVNISAFGFALKVVAVTFESNDAPEKVVAFYRDKLKEHGRVLECSDSYVNPDMDFGPGKRDSDSEELTCGKGEHEHGAVELKTGTKSNQRIVAIKPRGKGSEFALVRVQTRGKDTI